MKNLFKKCMVVNVIFTAIFYIVFLTSKTFRKKYWEWSIKLAGEAMEVMDEIQKTKRFIKEHKSN